MAIVATFMLWYALALLGLAWWAMSTHESERWIQAATATGLAPLAAATATWRLVESALVHWMRQYVREHIEAG